MKLTPEMFESVADTFTGVLRAAEAVPGGARVIAETVN